MTLTASARELQGNIRQMLMLSRYGNAQFTFVTLDFELKVVFLKACTRAAKRFLFANSLRQLEDLQYSPVAVVLPALFVTMSAATQQSRKRREMQHQIKPKSCFTKATPAATGAHHLGFAEASAIAI
jgi:hypothetical protein